jgi:hypothetical protein
MLASSRQRNNAICMNCKHAGAIIWIELAWLAAPRHISNPSHCPFLRQCIHCGFWEGWTHWKYAQGAVDKHESFDPPEWIFEYLNT